MDARPRPGRTALFALESAMDELSYALNIDPIELRLRSYAETDPESGKPFSGKNLREAYKMGAENIGWSDRSQKPGSSHERWLAHDLMAFPAAYLAPTKPTRNRKSNHCWLMAPPCTNSGK